MYTNTPSTSVSRAKRAHENTSYWYWYTTETIPRLLYQLSLQTNDLQPTYLHLHMYMCNTQPLSHHTRHYWTYWMLEYNYSSSTHTHLVTSISVQMQFVNHKLHNINMSFNSCMMDHGASRVISFVEQ